MLPGKGRIVSLVAALLVGVLAGSALADGKGTILVTGFEPFEGPVNPSWEAAKALDGTTVNGYQVVAVELPVDWKKVPQILEPLIRNLRPVSVISFGEGLPGQYGLEQVAHDHVDPNLEDNAHHHFKKSKIRKDGPDTYSSTLPLDQIEDALKATNLAVYRSTDAGSYLCEYTFYLDRYFTEKYHVTAPVGFVHVPFASEGQTDFSESQAAAKLVVQQVADSLDGVPAAEAPSPDAAPAADSTATPPVRIAPPIVDSIPGSPSSTRGILGGLGGLGGD